MQINVFKKDNRSLYFPQEETFEAANDFCYDTKGKPKMLKVRQ